MNKKMNIAKALPLFSAVLIGGFSYMTGRCGVNQDCDLYKIFAPLSFSVLEPLFLFSILALPTTVLVLFCNAQIFKVWKKFAFWWLFLSLIAILASPVSDNTWMPLYSINREIVTWLMGGLFTLISLGLITWKSFRKS